MKAFAGRTLWIVGASSGIGRALAVELAQRGANLILSGRDTAALASLSAELGGTPQILPLDVTQEGSLQAAYAQIPTPPDGLIYMAGTYTPCAIADLSAPLVDETLATNLAGAIAATSCVYADFTKRGYGLIALCGSVAGYMGLPNAQPYAASKAGLISFAQSLYSEARAHGLTIKLISPGFVRTRLTAKNSFTMPALLEPEQAAKIIADGLLSSAFEIHFPKRLSLALKLASLLPYSLYFALCRCLSK
jgi:short-subunit dehydrogenase